ncbi:DUF3341 domain-containing protein [Halomonas stenophila]|uniref:DUF3341 domain-containing protein n=1 Tax=Halomonas stenophila TaxID=795312 RepID=A0A7W5EUD7_9GAMM|nr:DUF3341 domain-containing protein [Halomonas stenophila]MBB3230940.1 hypothetical protein [Halomonas stenophila]
MAEQRRAATIALLARFESAETLLAALTALRRDGHRRIEAFSPYPVEGVAEALGFRSRGVALAALLLTLGVVTAGYFMQWYSAVIAYPYVVGGKPLHGWPAFVPVVVALGLLAAVLGAVIAMVVGNRLPQPYHPAFEAESFLRASDDAFFLLLPPDDDSDEARRRLSERLYTLQACEIEEVPRC